MKEIVLNNKKNGMAMMLLFILLLAASLALVIFSAVRLEAGQKLFAAPMIVGIVWLSFGWVPLIGLKVLKPQEALVLTLSARSRRRASTGSIPSAWRSTPPPRPSSTSPATWTAARTAAPR